MVKNKDSPYTPMRSKEWLKIKCLAEQEFVIGGYTNPAGLRKFFGALLLGFYNENSELIYCGKVGTGFSDLTLKQVYAYLVKNKRVKCPFAEIPKEKNVHWVKPVLIAEIKFKEWTKDDYLRQPVFQGLRFDKSPKDVTKEN